MNIWLIYPRMINTTHSRDCVERLALEMEDKYIKKDAVEELIDSKIKSEW